MQNRICLYLHKEIQITNSSYLWGKGASAGREET